MIIIITIMSSIMITTRGEVLRGREAARASARVPAHSLALISIISIISIISVIIISSSSSSSMICISIMTCITMLTMIIIITTMVQVSNRGGFGVL